MIEIKNRYTDEIILTVDADTLVGADLSGKDLSYSDLSYSDLSDCNLHGSNLSRSNLHGSNLCRSNLHESNLRGSDLRECDLRECDLDFACMPLWCGDLKAGYDDKQIIQQLYHVLSHVKYSQNASDDLKSKMLTDELIELANRFHRADESGKL